jgi:uncharacterized membrane protein
MRLFFLSSVTVAVMLAAGAARADLVVCSSEESNQSTFVAVAHEQSDGIRSVGWVMIHPGECRTLIRGDLQQQEYFIHAVDVRDDPVVGGRFRFCVDQANFSISGRENCQGRGFMERGFRRIRTQGNPNWRYEIRVIDPEHVEPEPLPLIP